MTPVWLRALAVALFGAAVALVLSAQTPKLCTYAGTVVESTTGAGIRRALIQVTGVPSAETALPPPNEQPPVPQPPFSASAFSDAGGAFRFDNLKCGDYGVTAMHPGYIPSGPPLALASSIHDARLKLDKLGVIEGTVTDSDGLPLRHIDVVALRVHIQDGARAIETSRNVSTDDRGRYRLWNLEPGNYYIKAAGRSGGTITYPGDRPPIFVDYESFVPVYYGGANSLALAMPIPIRSGSEERADLTLVLAPAHRVRGRLLNLTRGEAVHFEVLNGDEEVGTARVTVNPHTGAFQLHDLATGSYALRVTQGNAARGEVRITLGDVDLQDVQLELAPAVELKLRLNVANPPADAVGEPVGALAQDQVPSLMDRQGRLVGSLGVNRARLKPCIATLAPMLGTAHRITSHSAENDAEGELVFHGILPGRYRISFTCGGAYVTSAQWASTDLLANPVLTILPGVEPAPIEVNARFGGGTLEVEVGPGTTGRIGRPGLLLVPLFVDSTGPSVAYTYGPALDVEQAAVESGGNTAAQHEGGSLPFIVPNLAPGDYEVFAFRDLEGVEYQNPEFLRTLTGGTSVHVEDGKTTKLTVSRLRQ